MVPVSTSCEPTQRISTTLAPKSQSAAAPTRMGIHCFAPAKAAMSSTTARATIPHIAYRSDVARSLNAARPGLSGIVLTAEFVLLVHDRAEAAESGPDGG